MTDHRSILATLAAASLLSSCAKTTDEAYTPERQAENRRVNAIERQEYQLSGTAGHPVFIDYETGCQYIGYDTHGPTPRMSRYVNGKQHQMGCYIDEVQQEK